MKGLNCQFVLHLNKPLAKRVYLSEARNGFLIVYIPRLPSLRSFSLGLLTGSLSYLCIVIQKCSKLQLYELIFLFTQSDFCSFARNSGCRSEVDRPQGKSWNYTVSEICPPAPLKIFRVRTKNLRAQVCDSQFDQETRRARSKSNSQH
jgi:hypothetical protein